MDSELLTTGEVAKLCGVTPNAVLKWIKKGKLPATRTPGGHYRVSRETCAQLGLCEPTIERRDLGENIRADARMDSQQPRCWEFYGSQGNPREECRACVVYQARAQNCYALAGLGEEAGHQLNFCATECAECAFYRARQGLAIPMLVVTPDAALAQRLERNIDGAKVTLRFAKSGYESSTVVGAFRPAIVVLDSDLPEVREGQLSKSMQLDDRIPGALVIVASREGDEAQVREFSHRTIGVPFTARLLEELAAEVTQERGGLSRDGVA